MHETAVVVAYHTGFVIGFYGPIIAAIAILYITGKMAWRYLK